MGFRLDLEFPELQLAEPAHRMNRMFPKFGASEGIIGAGANPAGQ